MYFKIAKEKRINKCEFLPFLYSFPYMMPQRPCTQFPMEEVHCWKQQLPWTTPPGSVAGNK